MACWSRSVLGLVEELLQVRPADLGGLAGIAVVGVELDDEPAVVAGFPHGAEDVPEVEVSLAERQELPGLQGDVLEVDVPDPVSVLADLSGRVPAPRGQVGGVRAEGDPG